MANEGISERASNIILSSRREGTNSNYCSSWNKWPAGVININLIHFGVL